MRVPFVIPSRVDGEGSRAMRGSLAALGMTLALLLACARTHVDRAQWQRMSASEKTLYVRTLLGHEKVKEAKGGNGRNFDRAPEE